MSGRTPITPWSARQDGAGGTGVSGESLAAAPAVQALQPLIDGASMASSPGAAYSLFGALAAAQGAMQNAEKNQQAKVGRDGGTRMYADLAAVLAAVREPLGSQELAIIQLPLMDLSVSPPRLSVATVLGHSSGQWIGVRMDAEAPTHGRHERPASAGQRDVTYLRRYGLSAITGMAQQDADGAGGTGQPERDPRQEPAGQKLRAEIDGMLGKLIARQGSSSRECVEPNSRTMPELAQVRNRVKELAVAPARPAPAPAQLAAAPAAKQEHTPERAAKINRLVSALDAVQASDAAVAKRMTAADQMATGDLEDCTWSAWRRTRVARGKRTAEADDHRAEQQEMGVGGAE